MSVAEMILGTGAKVFGKIFGTANERELKRIWPLVEAVNACGAKYRDMSDDEVKAQTAVLRRRLLNGESEDDILPDAFAICREASHRTLGEKKMVPTKHDALAFENGNFVYNPVDHEIQLFAHFDVQIIGGVVLHQGKIAEMVTGEGKTLVATLPCYLNALRVTDEWRVKAEELQGKDSAKWTFKPYGKFVKDGAETWRLMERLLPEPGDVTWQNPEQIIPLSRGVHIVTVNDYLASRDALDNTPLFNFLGIMVGAIQAEMDPEERVPIYMGDITYGTNNEYGFDYLRDNLKVEAEQQVQRSRFFSIVDEVDSVLIDEARTPLIISGNAQQETKKYYLADKVPRHLQSGEMNDVEDRIAEFMRDGRQREDARMAAEEDYDFVYSERDHSAKLTERGMHKALRVLGMDDIYSGDNLDMPHYVDNALKAHALYKKDHHYIIDQGQIKIVDEHTGRVMEGRRWSDGLHQAIEAKEGLRIKEESQTVATITFQNFFKLYDRLSGMTGTAMTEAKEFHKIYQLGAVSIPTNRPLRRVNHPDLIYGTEKEKFNSLAEHVYDVYRTGQPMLVGTVSVQRSEIISEILKRRGIPHNVLNAKQHDSEADLIDVAGHLGKVTVATNMAGRGTDIKLGTFTPEELLEHWQQWGLAPKKNIRADMPEDQLRESLRQHWVKLYLGDIDAEYQSKPAAEWDTLLANRWEEIGMLGPRWVTRVADMGGLHIVGTERHEARRIDNQLRGRAGRQGDPGSSRFFLSLEDDTMRMFAPEKAKKFMQWAGLKDGMPIESRMVSGTVERAQRKVEERNFEIRKNLLEYDQVMNEQRLIVYGKRQAWLEDRELKDSMLQSCENFTYRNAMKNLSGDIEDWDIGTLCATMNDTFGTDIKVVDIETFHGQPEVTDKVTDMLFARVQEAYEEKEKRVGADTMRMIEKMLLLETLDRKWMDHLYEMDLMKEGIHLVSYAQKDAKIEYKKKGYAYFEELWETLDAEVADLVMKVQPVEEMGLEQNVQLNDAVHQDFDTYAAEQAAIGADIGETQMVTIKNELPRVGRNEPCPCGSGKKFKKCCGR